MLKYVENVEIHVENMLKMGSKKTRNLLDVQWVNYFYVKNVSF
jgi:hypothetical protein